MRELSFVGLSEDGTCLVLSTTDGTRYSLAFDDSLEGAIRRDRNRLGQPELSLDGVTPRDIQQRVRHGQDPDDIAASSGLSIERVLRFAGPVIAERQHITQQAIEVEIRLEGEYRTVKDIVQSVLDGGGIDAGLLEWDSWRREDGRWSLLASWDPRVLDGIGSRDALWIFDPADRTVVPDDLASAWVFGDRPTVEVSRGKSRPFLVALGSAPEVEISSWTEDVDDPDAAFTAMVDRDSGAHLVQVVDRSPIVAINQLPVEPDLGGPGDIEYTSPHTDPDSATPPEPTRTSRRARRKTGREAPARAVGDVEKGEKPRATVPSWDEILFGSRNPDA